jgi:hypothetical protein
MKVALGMKSHSGWAALVVVGRRDAEFMVVDRRRVELAEEVWAKQPYHAAGHLEGRAARELVARGMEAARRITCRTLSETVKRQQERNNDVVACAVLVGDPMPNWSIEEILAVHIRMHKAEGVLFRDALVGAAETCGLSLDAIPEKLLIEYARKALARSASGLMQILSTLGKSVGPPWGKDQKDAALAAMIVLHRHFPPLPG